MIERVGTGLQYSIASANNTELDLVIPEMSPSIVYAQWEFIDLIYKRSSNADPVDLVLEIRLKDSSYSFIVRKVTNFGGFDFYFLLNKELTSEWEVRFRTVGAAGKGYDHDVVLFWRA